jgi:DNA (cytosine-5)-methyltransferase 1
MNFLDVFCGAGGLSLGFTSAGWQCVGAMDAWDDALETYRQNFPSHYIVHDDIARLRAKKLGEFRGVDWIIGGPPCQGFSTVGKRHPRDPRNELIRCFARVVQELTPKGFLLENVVGLRDMRLAQDTCELFESIGYRVTVFVLRSADFGVPQLRHRIFFVGDASGLIFRRPTAIFKPSRYTTVWDAIGDLPRLWAGESAEAYSDAPFTRYQRHMRRGSTMLQGHDASAHPPHLVRAISFIPDGGDRGSIPDRYQPRSGFHNSYSRLHSGSPAVAVTQNMGKPSGTRCIHPFQDRGLTAREGARLQGFPDTFHFAGGITSQRIQIANAVSPILAKTLALTLLEDRQWLVRDCHEPRAYNKGQEAS